MYSENIFIRAIIPSIAEWFMSDHSIFDMEFPSMAYTAAAILEWSILNVGPFLLHSFLQWNSLFHDQNRLLSILEWSFFLCKEIRSHWHIHGVLQFILIPSICIAVFPFHQFMAFIFIGVEILMRESTHFHIHFCHLLHHSDFIRLDIH